jgi:hypothetical protein
MKKHETRNPSSEEMTPEEFEQFMAEVLFEMIEDRIKQNN